MKIFLRMRATVLNDKCRVRITSVITAVVLAILTQGTAVANDPQTMVQKLKSLEELYFVKQSIQGQSHKGALTRISSSQAMKSVRGANPALGFEYTDRVQEYLDLFTEEQNRKGTEIMLGLASGYLSLFESYLIEEKLPAELMYLPLALSSLNTRAVSVWGASGLWQIMYTNGRLYELQIDSYIDERRDPAKATRAALQHLKDLYAIYQSWDLAVIAYTSSPSNLNKAIRKAGGSKKASDLYTWLPAETRDLLPAYTACFVLMHHFDKTGLKPYEIQNPAFFLRAPVEKRLHLGQVAEVLSIAPEYLSDMNPEYKTGIVPAGAHKTYWIKLPPEKHHLFAPLADSIYQYKDSIYFPTRKTVVVSEIASTVQAEEAANDQNAAEPQAVTKNTHSTPSNRTKLTYTVKDGDNLGYISQWYNVSVSEIRSWNSLRGDVIRVGQVLDIWVPDSKASRYSRIDSMSFSEKQKGGSSAQKPSGNASSSQTTTSSGSATGKYTWYTVRSGETISGIAAKYPGVTADEILTLNKIKDPRSLQVGQKIKIPKK